MEPTQEEQAAAEQFLGNFVAPPLPTTSSEFITALAHYHRAEIARMAGWRDRIDRTTNWAITGVAAMLSLSLSTPSAHHGVLLFAMILVLLLLLIEARRYRFFDVYRRRVRLIERNYFAQMLAPADEIKESWTQSLGEDLRRPKFLMSLRAAMSRRLRRNYAWMFLILLLAWILKISTPKLQNLGVSRDVAGSLQEIIGNASLGPLPGWLVVVIVFVFYCWVAYATFRSTEPAGELSYGDVHV
ncbi:DUF2270 domain-containing protein [Mesorhizobium sp. BAC0120]|uniref:DUF2270 domain-containing protein n=1 Tax=Mesorhizobium sp. BAC0120 TaxID=3090670 RepID=UPI00298BE6CC|nr:DUF2270 domain-containing protein [Mesorhizobium sp. BAC0120]MDW6024117.1 DUF2270 domain-containing protein [Mesorhizobium sp. BAC0120]